MRVLTIASGKGGTSKTTTAATFAAILAERGDRVLLVDADPQGSASLWLGVQPSGGSLLDILEGKASLRALVGRSVTFGVDVLPASPALATAERALAGQPLAVLGLRRALADSAGAWDWAIVDCPPALGLLTSAAVATSSAVLATAEPTALGLVGLADLLALVDGIGQHVTPAPFVAGVLACRVPSRQRLAATMLDVLRQRWPGLVLDATIRESVKARECAAAGQPLTRWDPSGPLLADYRQALGELEERMTRGHQR